MKVVGGAHPAAACHHGEIRWEASLDSNENSELKARLARNIRDLKRWTKIWDIVHQGLMFGAALLSTSATVILQLKLGNSDAFQKNAASILSACAALAGVISASGAFERKWRTCRSTLSQLRELEFDMGRKPEDDAIRDRYKAIWQAYEQGIIGSDTSNSP
jgi:hypothetical protein